MILVGGGAFATSNAWADTSIPNRPIASGSTPSGTAQRPVKLLGDRILKAFRDGKVSGAPSPSASTTSASGGASPRIIGGVTSPINSAPWMVQLWYANSDGTASFCGGTLVAPNKVLTAAHCVAGLDWYNNGVVVGGTSNLWDGTNGNAVRVWTQWSNPSFSGSTLQNDIAVLTLDVPLPYPTASLAAPTDAALYGTGKTGTVYGWGLTTNPNSPNAQLSTQLRQADMPLVDDSTCQTAMDKVKYGAFVAGKMICAGNPTTGSDQTTVSSCYGDSGGPLMVDGRIAGIVSWGVSDCVQAGAYDVYTKVSTYSDAAAAQINANDGAPAAGILPGQGLNPGDSLTSGSMRLVMQSDGNLVAYLKAGGSSAPAEWSSGTSGHPGAYAVMQSDGNLVVYSQSGGPSTGGALWSSRTYGNPGAYAVLQDDGNLVVYRKGGGPSTGGALWSSHSYAKPQTIGSGQALKAGWWTQGQLTFLVMQPDGNLVMYRKRDGAAIWSSRTYGHPGAYAVMQSDGNLVVYRKGGGPTTGGSLWASNTSGHSGAYAVMQDDGNLVVYRKGGGPTTGGSLWASNTWRTAS
jgi:hypothetical protein